MDVSNGEVFAHEALVRGPNGEGAGSVFAHVNDGNRYRFDQACRVKAIRLAAELGVTCGLSINFLPNAVYRPELCIRTTLLAADQYGFPIEQIIFEVTEGERIDDHPHMRNILEHYQKQGFRTAIDDFGAGYAGLGLLAEFQPDLVKLDMALIRGIDSDRVRVAIARGILQTARDLGISVIAEGVETASEYATLRDLGVELFQGYYFARPAFEALAEISSEALAGRA
ncbi:MAG: EAL domain-containing protein [Zoogloeaceae bacterium]|nr:EAL domain-containing protein [Zoogloeaceae bacterium]